MTRPLSVYLVASYSRREEIAAYAAALQEAGFVVTARWLQGAAQTLLDGAELGIVRAAIAEEHSDVFVAFYWWGRQGSRRTRLRALALRKLICVVGLREHFFHSLDNIRELVTTFDQLRDVLSEWRDDR